ncbi:MAG: VWA domain containing CoxE-like protein [Lentisphaerae bacterium ADurb.BinA184]|nr:MAG: VWA domain containing CoxE-like protein [Lentisphaerae bacterium ADurb.BinA184]
MVEDSPHGFSSLLSGELADRVRRLELFSRFRVEGLLSGTGKSPFKGFTADFLQHRQYFPGDPLKHLDWRVYGKSERLFIREYEELTNTRLTVVLDVSGSMSHTGASWSKHEFAIRAAAIVTYLAMAQRDSFSLALFREGRAGHVPFGGGRQHLRRVFAALLDTPPRDGTDFSRGLAEATSTVRHRGLTMVFSDFMDDPEAVVRRLAQLRYRGHDVIAAQVHDPSEQELDFNSVTRFHDPEGPTVLVVDPQLIQRQYRLAFETHLAALKGACHRHGFEFIALPVGDAFEVPVFTYLQRRLERFTR